MKTDRDNENLNDLLQIACSVADGEKVDWDEAESSAPKDQQSLIRKLKVISKVSGTHRGDFGIPGRFAGDSGYPRENFKEDSWGPLQILEKVGDGAFGEVFRAHDPRLDREVALKLYYPDRPGATDQTSELIEEGRLLARVHHPNVATVFGAEQHAERVGIWMEFIEGATLAKVLQDQGTLSAEEAMLIGRDICRALAALHGAGIIHRDVKASNIMRAEGGRIVLMDLGVSREMDGVDSERVLNSTLCRARGFDRQQINPAKRFVQRWRTAISHGNRAIPGFRHHSRGSS